MDSDRVEGRIREAGGEAKEGWGDLTNDEETEAEGQADQAEGKLQSGWGDLKDDVREAVDDDR